VSKVASFALLLTVGRLLTIYGLFRWTYNMSTSDLVAQLHRYDAVGVRLEGILFAVAAASVIAGNLAALAQTSVRRLLAYSAIAHAGYVILGLSTGHHLTGKPGEMEALLSSWRYLIASQHAVLYYVLTYGLTIIGAFGVVSIVERATGSDRLDAFLGLHKRNPLLAAVLLVLFLSLAGIPPLVGFWAKFNLFAAVLGVSAGPIPFALVSLAVAMSAVSLYYYLQVLKRAYVMPAADESPIKAHPVTMAVLVLIAVAVVVLGCFPALLQNWIASFYPAL
jgi:NADH-quinone oxidoreductase subunit N